MTLKNSLNIIVMVKCDKKQGFHLPCLIEILVKKFEFCHY